MLKQDTWRQIAALKKNPFTLDCHVTPFWLLHTWCQFVLLCGLVLRRYLKKWANTVNPSTFNFTYFHLNSLPVFHARSLNFWLDFRTLWLFPVGCFCVGEASQCFCSLFGYGCCIWLQIHPAAPLMMMWTWFCVCVCTHRCIIIWGAAKWGNRLNGKWQMCSGLRASLALLIYVAGEWKRKCFSQARRRNEFTPWVFSFLFHL